jgi:hypothetical protein
MSSTGSSYATNAESMELESLPRHFRDDQDDASSDSMSTSTTASQGKGHHAPPLSTPVRNNIARVMSRHDDPFFDCEETVDRIPRLIYKPMGPFTTDVSVEEVKQVISVSEGGLTWVWLKVSVASLKK